MTDIFRGWKPKKDPWMPADYDDDVVFAVQALNKGLASDSQQRLVWDWLMHVTGEDDWPFRPGDAGSQATNIALGKQFVGKQLRKMLHPAVTPKSIHKPKDDEGKR